MTTAAEPWARGHRRNYTPLVDFLRALPTKRRAVVLTFTAIEALLGRPLPPISKWSNSYWMFGATAKRHWQAAGFTAHPIQQDQAVMFRRMAATDGGSS